MNFKKTVRNLHLWLGLASGIIIFIVALTGCIYVFEEEIRSYTQHDFDFVTAQDSERISLDIVIDSFKRNHADTKLLFIKQKESVPNATIVLGNKEVQFAYNPYNGEEVKSLKSNEDFFATVLKIHRNLLLGDVGEKIIGVATFVFLFMLFSGLVLWFPTTFRNVRSYFTISNKSAKRLNFDLHRVGGFYASLILVVIASTGLFFSYEFVKGTVYSIIDSKPYRKWGPSSGTSQPLKTDAVYMQIQKEYPNCIESSIYYPDEKEGTIRIKLKYPYEYIPKYNTFFVDKLSGKIVETDLDKNATTAEYLKNSIYGIHTGSMFGIFGKAIAFLSALTAATLPVTGFLIWRRKKKVKSKQSKTLELVENGRKI